VKLIYLAGPYTHDDKEVMEYRFILLTRIASNLIQKGFNPISPITHSHMMNEYGELPTTWDFWKKIDIQILNRCDEIWVVTEEGWKESVGVTAEIAHAVKVGKPIRYVDPGEIFSNKEFERFYKEHHDKMLNYVAKKIGQPARAQESRALVNNVFISISKSWNTFDSEYQTKRINWAYGVAGYVVKTYLRDRTLRQARTVHLNPMLLEDLHGTADSGGSIENKQILKLMEEKFSDKLFSVLDLKYKGYTYQEISEMLDIPLNTAASRMRLIREHPFTEKLKEDLKDIQD
jgi:RNA polymerase sigma factor (sigma-70 family)